MGSGMDSMATEQPSTSPAVGWAISHPIRPPRFPNLRWARAAFVAAECIVNGIFLTYLILAIAGVDVQPSNQGVILTAIIWADIGSNIILLLIGSALRYLGRRTVHRRS